MADFEAESIEVTLEEVTIARGLRLASLGVSWDELERRIKANDYTTAERRAWLTYKGIDLAVRDGHVHA